VFVRKNSNVNIDMCTFTIKRFSKLFWMHSQTIKSHMNKCLKLHSCNLKSCS